MHLPLLIIAALVSFFSNWQFAFQVQVHELSVLLFDLLITYVNTSVRTFHSLVDKAYSFAVSCNNCTIGYSSWSTQWSIIIASFYPGTILGFLLVPVLVSHSGVRWSLAITCFPAIIGSLIQLASIFVLQSGNVTFDTFLCVGRFLVGIQAGSSLCLLPLFITEISPLRYRGLLSAFQQVSQSLATVIGFVVGSENIVNLGEHRFEWLQFIALLPSLLFLVTLVLLPETPRHYFLRTGDIRRGDKALNFYCGEIDAATIGEELQKEVSEMRYAKISCNPIAIKGLLIGCVAAVSFAFTADDVIDTFSAHILHTSAHSMWATRTDLTADLTTVFLGIVLLISSIFGSLLIDKIGRRSLLVFGLVGTSISNGIAVLTSFFGSSALITIAFALTKCFIGLGAGAPAWFLTSELVPPSTTFLYQAISTGVLLVASGVVTLFFLKLEYVLGLWSILVVASGPALISALLLYLFLPETKHRTYDETRAQLSDVVFSGIHKSPIYHRIVGYGATNDDTIIVY